MDELDRDWQILDKTAWAQRARLDFHLARLGDALVEAFKLRQICDWLAKRLPG